MTRAVPQIEFEQTMVDNVTYVDPMTRSGEYNRVNTLIKVRIELLPKVTVQLVTGSIQEVVYR